MIIKNNTYLKASLRKKQKNFKVNLFLSYFEVFYLSIFNLFWVSAIKMKAGIIKISN